MPDYRLPGRIPLTERVGLVQTAAHPALLVDRSHGLFQSIAAYDNRDRQLTGALRDGDNIHIRARDSSEDASSQARSPAHSFSHHSQQAHIFIHLDGTQITMRQL